MEMGHFYYRKEHKNNNRTEINGQKKVLQIELHLFYKIFMKENNERKKDGFEMFQKKEIKESCSPCDRKSRFF